MPDRLSRLYDEHADALFAFALNLTRSETDTRDILQDLFLKLARQPDLMDGVQNERGFLLKMAHRLVIDAVRRRATRTEYHRRLAAETPDLFLPAQTEVEAEFRRDVAAAMADLPEEQRAVVHLKLWEEMTFEGIAALLEIPLHTAASRYRYALDKLRHRLRPLHENLK